MLILRFQSPFAFNRYLVVPAFLDRLLDSLGVFPPVVFVQVRGLHVGG